MSDASLTILVLALRELEVDGVRIAEGEKAQIRRELVAALVACGAVNDEVEATVSEGEGAAGAAPGGPVPQPAQPGGLEPGVPADAKAGDDSPPGGARGSGDAATGAAADDPQAAEQAGVEAAGEPQAAAVPPRAKKR